MKVKLYIQATKYSFDNEFQTHVNTYEHKTDGTQTVVTIGTAEVEVDIPEVSNEEFLTLAYIEQLKGLKSEVQAACNARVLSIDNEIGKLLALTGEVEK